MKQKYLTHSEIDSLSKSIHDPFLLSYLSDAEKGMDVRVSRLGNIIMLNFPASAIVITKNSSFSCEELESLSALGLNAILTPQPLPIPGYTATERTLMRATPSSFRKKERNERLKVLRTREDFLMLFSLYRSVPGMEESFEEEEDEENCHRFLSFYYPFAAVALTDGSKALSAAYLVRAESILPMITCVATLPEERRKGYAASVVSELMDISFNENRIRELALWCTEECAARIYRALGFADSGRWFCLKKGK